jgi:hypothetical protein
VHFELRKSNTELLIHLINPERLWNKKAPKRRDVTVSLALPADITIVDIKFTSPNVTLAKPAPHINAKKTENPRRAAKSLRAQKAVPSASPADTTASPNPDQDSQWSGTLPFTLGEGKVTFKVPLEAYAMVVISTKPR